MLDKIRSFFKAQSFIHILLFISGLIIFYRLGLSKTVNPIFNISAFLSVACIVYSKDKGLWHKPLTVISVFILAVYIIARPEFAIRDKNYSINIVCAFLTGYGLYRFFPKQFKYLLMITPITLAIYFTYSWYQGFAANDYLYGRLMLGSSNPNILARHAAVAISYIMLTEHLFSLNCIVFLMPIVIACLLCLLFTGSKTPVIALLCVICYKLFFKFSKRFLLIVISVILLIFSALLFVSNQNTTRFVDAFTNFNASARLRKILQSVAINEIKEKKPLFGLKKYRYIIEEYTKEKKDWFIKNNYTDYPYDYLTKLHQCHNSYLEAILRFGIIGFLLISFVIITNIRLLKTVNSPLINGLLIYALITSFSEDFIVAHIGYFIFFPLGILLAESYLKIETQSQESSLVENTKDKNDISCI